MSNALTSVVIPATLPAEDKPPNTQTHLTKDEFENETAKALDYVSNTLKEYWDNLTFDGNPVKPILIKSKNEIRNTKIMPLSKNLKTWNQMKNLLLRSKGIQVLLSTHC